MSFFIIAFSIAVLWWYGCVDVLRVGGRQVIVKMIDIYTDFHEPPPRHCTAAVLHHHSQRSNNVLNMLISYTFSVVQNVCRFCRACIY